MDERYDTAKALDGAARYLALARRRLGRGDLAAASYHMGIGNLERVIAAYAGPRAGRSTRVTVRRLGITYPRLFFDSSPLRHRAAWRLLSTLGDDSRHYLFKLEAARRIRDLHRNDAGALAELHRLQRAKASAEEVLRPRSRHAPYADGETLVKAYANGELVRLPAEPARLGYTINKEMGRLAGRLGDPIELYRGLRPDALAALLYVSKEVYRLARGSRLVITSSVRDLRYQRLLVATNPQATRAFSLHTTGFAFDIERDFRHPKEQRALETVLERLRALEVVDWVHEPGAIHVTVGPRAVRLAPLYEALVQRSG